MNGAIPLVSVLSYRVSARVEARCNRVDAEGGSVFGASARNIIMPFTNHALFRGRPNRMVGDAPAPLSGSVTTASPDNIARRTVPDLDIERLPGPGSNSLAMLWNPRARSPQRHLAHTEKPASKPIDVH